MAMIFVQTLHGCYRCLLTLLFVVGFNFATLLCFWTILSLSHPPPPFFLLFLMTQTQRQRQQRTWTYNTIHYFFIINDGMVCIVGFGSNWDK
jgi:hypothetical protein